MHYAHGMDVRIARLDDERPVADAHPHPALLLVDNGVVVGMLVRGICRALGAKGLEADQRVRGHQHLDRIDTVLAHGIVGFQLAPCALRAARNQLADVLAVHEGDRPLHCGHHREPVFLASLRGIAAFFACQLS